MKVEQHVCFRLNHPFRLAPLPRPYLAAEVCSPLFLDWHRPCHVIEGSPMGVAALAAAFETCGVSIEGRVTGHPAILGGLSSEPAASHPFENSVHRGTGPGIRVVVGFFGWLLRDTGRARLRQFFSPLPLPGFLSELRMNSTQGGFWHLQSRTQSCDIVLRLGPVESSQPDPPFSLIRFSDLHCGQLSRCRHSHR